jgi:hypothetical protein
VFIRVHRRPILFYLVELLGRFNIKDIGRR